MQTLKKCVLLFITALFLGACSYTPEEQARYDQQRAYWDAQSGRGADSSR